MTQHPLHKTCVLIAGLPRSGTSSVAQLLDHLGVYFGDPADFLDTTVHTHNPVFYELAWINDVNDRLIAAACDGAGYFDDVTPVEADLAPDRVAAVEDELRQKFSVDFGGRPLVGVKDPRLCFTLPVWRRVLAAAGYAVRVVLTLRDPAAVIKSNSLLREDAPRQWQRFYARHLLAFRYFTRDVDVCQVDFDQLMREPAATATDLATCLGLPIPDPADATRHLSGAHYHHRPGPGGTGDAWVDAVDADLRAGRLDADRYLAFRDVAHLFGDQVRGLRLRGAELAAELAAKRQLAEDLEQVRVGFVEWKEGAEAAVALKDAQLEAKDRVIAGLEDVHRGLIKWKEDAEAAAAVKDAELAAMGRQIADLERLPGSLAKWRDEEAMPALRSKDLQIAEASAKLAALESRLPVRALRAADALRDTISRRRQSPAPCRSGEPAGHSPNLERVSDAVWEARDGDPWFLLAGPFPAGRYTLTFRGRRGDGVPPSNARLYLADAAGNFGESDAIVFGPLPQAAGAQAVGFPFELKRPVPALRFDPQDVPGRFELHDLKPVRQSQNLRALRLAATLAKRVALSPRATFAAAARYLEAPTAPPGTSGTGAGERLATGDSLPDVVPMNLRAVAGKPPRLNVLIPGLVLRAMSGGPNTAINLTYRLARHGIPVRYISTDVDMEKDPSGLYDHFSKVSNVPGRLDNVELVSAHDRGRVTEIGRDDVFFGTAWWTVQMIKAALPQMRHQRFLYMIQDFEPGLYPWSTRYALAAETYGMNFFGIINAKTLARHLFDQRVGRFADPAFADDCIAFDPALDRRLFHPELAQEPGGRKRLLFYARPGAPRNMFELGMVALKQAALRGAFPPDQWELRFIGDDLPDVDFGNGVVVRQAPWADYHGYAGLLRSSTVGLSLMLSPHPSYPPLEMGMCGMLAVTTSYGPKTPDVLRSYCANVTSVEPNVEAIVDGLLDAVRRSDDVAARRAGAVSSLPGDWDHVFEPMVPRILEMWERCRQS